MSQNNVNQIACTSTLQFGEKHGFVYKRNGRFSKSRSLKTHFVWSFNHSNLFFLGFWYILCNRIEICWNISGNNLLLFCPNSPFWVPLWQMEMVRSRDVLLAFWLDEINAVEIDLCWCSLLTNDKSEFYDNVITLWNNSFLWCWSWKKSDKSFSGLKIFAVLKFQTHIESFL